MKKRLFNCLKGKYIYAIIIIFGCIASIALLGYYTGKNVKCIANEIDVGGIPPECINKTWLKGYEVSSKELKEMLKHPHDYKQVDIICDTGCNSPIDIFNFTVIGHYNKELSNRQTGKKIFINNYKGDSGHEFIDIDTGSLEFNFLVKADGRTDEQVFRDVEKSKFQITGHTNIPLLKVTFDMKVNKNEVTGP